MFAIYVHFVHIIYVGQRTELLLPAIHSGCYFPSPLFHLSSR